MKKAKGKIRKEVKFSTEEWNKVVELSAKCGKLPAAYIRDQALNIKIKVIDVFSPDDGVVDIRNKFHREMNEVAKTVNTHKAVFTSDVEEVERIINEMGEFSRNGLHTIAIAYCIAPNQHINNYDGYDAKVLGNLNNAIGIPLGGGKKDKTALIDLVMTYG